MTSAPLCVFSRNDLGYYSFGQNQYFVLQYFNHTPVNRECLLTRIGLNHNRPPIQRTNHGRMVIQHLKLTLAAWKRNGTGLAGKNLTVRSNNV